MTLESELPNATGCRSQPCTHPNCPGTKSAGVGAAPAPQRQAPDWRATHGCTDDCRTGRACKRADEADAVRGAGGPASGLSDFIRNAAPERKAEVYGEVMDKVAEQQRAVIDAAGVPEGPK